MFIVQEGGGHTREKYRWNGMIIMFEKNHRETFYKLTENHTTLHGDTDTDTHRHTLMELQHTRLK